MLIQNTTSGSDDDTQGHPRRNLLVTCGARPKIEGGVGQGIQYLVSLQWPVVQLDFSDGMHMTENSDMPQSARMRAQIQANTGKYRQFWTPEIQSAWGRPHKIRRGGRT